MSLASSRNATSSQASGAGPTHSDLRECQTMNPSGLEAAHASRGAKEISRRKVAEDLATRGIYGRRGMGSSMSIALQSSLESRLRTQWEKDGGTSLPAIWKKRITPAGRSYCQLALTVRTMRGKDCSGWPTPAARDGKDLSRSNAHLAARARHSPSIVTRLLVLGAPWPVISLIYCLAMGYPSAWHEGRLRAMAMQSSLKSRRRSSGAYGKTYRKRI